MGLIMADIASPNHVSDYLLVYSRGKGDVLTNLKLQKLLYYSQAWYLALYDVPIFDEEFEAWIHGPVLPSQYRRFRHYEWRQIDENVRKPDALPSKLTRHLNEITRIFGVETAAALEIMTHKETPWIRARRNMPNREPSNAIISKGLMREYYRHMT
jgi:uncharacterized phage-associated protein